MKKELQIRKNIFQPLYLWVVFRNVDTYLAFSFNLLVSKTFYKISYNHAYAMILYDCCYRCKQSKPQEMDENDSVDVEREDLGKYADLFSFGILLSYIFLYIVM